MIANHDIDTTPNEKTRIIDRYVYTVIEKERERERERWIQIDRWIDG